MARLLLVLVPLLAVVASTDASMMRGDMEGEQDDYYNFDEIDIDDEECGPYAAYDNGLKVECQPAPVCNVTWCQDNCDRKCTGDQPCVINPLCVQLCPCPLYSEKDLNISVSCHTAQSVMDFDFSKIFNLSLDTTELLVSISMQVLFHRDI